MKKNSMARWLALAIAASCTGCASDPAARSQGWFASWSNPFASQVASERPDPRKDADDELSLENKVPPKADFFLATGALAESRGDNDTAIAQYQQAISKDPKNVKAHLHLARLYDRLQRYPEAESAYASAMAAAPNNATPINDYAMCLARQRRYDESIEQFQRAITLQRHQALYRNNIAEVLVMAGRPREAFDHLSAVHSPAESHYNMAMLLRRNGEIDPARQQMASALQIDPNLAGGDQFLAELGGAPHASHRPQPPATREVAAPRNLRAQIRDDRSAEVAAPSDAESQEDAETSPAAPQKSGGYYDGMESGDPNAASPAEVLARKPKNARKSASELRAKINDASAKMR